MHDLSELDARGVAGVNVVTTEFERAAECQCDDLGFEAAIVFVPHPIQNRTARELRDMASAHLDRILDAVQRAPSPGS